MNACLGGAWRGHNVPLLVCEELSLEELGGWLMPDSEEEAIHLRTQEACQVWNVDGMPSAHKVPITGQHRTLTDVRPAWSGAHAR